MNEDFNDGYKKAIDDFERSMEKWSDNIEKIRGSSAFFTIQDIKYEAEKLRNNLEFERRIRNGKKHT